MLSGVEQQRNKGFVELRLNAVRTKYPDKTSVEGTRNEESRRHRNFVLLDFYRKIKCGQGMHFGLCKLVKYILHTLHSYFDIIVSTSSSKQLQCDS